MVLFGHFPWPCWGLPEGTCSHRGSLTQADMKLKAGAANVDAEAAKAHHSLYPSEWGMTQRSLGCLAHLCFMIFVEPWPGSRSSAFLVVNVWGRPNGKSPN